MTLPLQVWKISTRWTFLGTALYRCDTAPLYSHDQYRYCPQCQELWAKLQYGEGGKPTLLTIPCPSHGDGTVLDRPDLILTVDYSLLTRELSLITRSLK